MTKRKGILLAGGSATRLLPATSGFSKQLLPVYDKPMIYYSLSTLMLAGIREVAVITTPRDADAFVSVLGNGSRWGMELRYFTQDEPKGIAQALTIPRRWLDGAAPVLVLGDNILYGQSLTETLRGYAADTRGATIFGCPVRDPQRYGVVELDAGGRAISLEEKPTQPKSNLAVPGLYFYDANAPLMAESLEPSARGELEITDINRLYLAADLLYVGKLGRGTTWLDMGTPESLLEAANFVSTIQNRQGFYIACPEEIAFHNGWISAEALDFLAQRYAASDYGAYLASLRIRVSPRT